MAIELGTAYVTLLPSTRGFGKAVNQELRTVESGAKRSGKRAGDNIADGVERGGRKGSGKLGGLLKAGLVGAAAAAGVAAGAVFMSSISKASDLEQSKGGVDAIFKGQADAIHEAAKGAAQGLGLTQNAYNELSTTLGAGLKNKGIEDFAGQTQNLVGLGADLAAQFGGSTSDAVSAISSLMRGETDPIEKYGVGINEVAIKAELAARGQDKLTGSALEAAKAQARVDLLFKQTADAQGAFARESDTLAGKQARATAQWENLQATIGEKFLPVVTAAMGFVNDKVIPALTDMGKWLEGAGKAVGDFFSQPPSPAIADAMAGIESAVDGMWAVVGPILQDVWDWLVVKWAEIQPKLQKLWGSVENIVKDAMSVVESIIKVATAAIKWIWDKWGDEIMKIVGILVDTVVGTISGFVKTLEGIWKFLSSLLKGDTQGMSDGIKLIFSGLFTAVESLFRGAVGVLGQVWSGIKSAFAGPVNWVISNVINPLINAINGVAAAFGASFRIGRVALMVSTSSTTSGRATSSKGSMRAFSSGGYTGPGGKYKPAGIVHAGEVVWSQEDVRRWGGAGVVDAMRRLGGAEGYAGGGIVANASQGWRNYNPGFLSALRAWASATGRQWYMTGNGGARSRADQQRAWNLYRAGLGPLAARPGTSAHERGLAIDLSPRPGQIPAAAALLGRFGLGLTVRGEPWHVGSRGAGGGGGGGGGGFNFDPLAPLRALLGKKAPGPLGSILDAIPSKLFGLATSKFKELFGFDSGGWLQPGLTLAYNNTGKPEPVLTGDQWSDLKSGGLTTERMDYLAARIGQEVLAGAGLVSRKAIESDNRNRQAAGRPL